MKDSTKKTMMWVTTAVLGLATVLSIVAVFVGGVSFSNPLPGNPFDYDGWLHLLIFPFALVGGFYGLKIGVKQFFEEDWETVTVERDTGKVVNRDRMDGCVNQLFVMLLSPLLGYAIAYAIVYYILYAILAVFSFILPYLILLAMAAGVGFFYTLVVKAKPTEEEPAAEEPQPSEEEPSKFKWLKSAGKWVVRYKGIIIPSLLNVVYLLAAILFLNAGFGLFSSDSADTNVETPTEEVEDIGC